MAKRAFIIAIENYAQLQEGLNSTLPGTHKYALAFRDWLIGTQQLAPGDIFFCTEDPALAGRTSDATRSAIKQELKRFKDVAKDTTDDMFFYFSGHGFSYVDVDDVPTADVLLAADFVKREESGDACLKLDEIQKWLKMCLGSVTSPGSTRCGHFYFIDACRNKITEKEIKVAPLGLVFDPSVRKKAPVYTMCSTTVGAVANVSGGFPEALIDGLNGKGKAKRFFEGTFTVLFDSLRGYIERRLETEVDPRSEGGDGVIRKLDPSLRYTCSVSVKNAGATDEFQVQVKNDLGQVVDSFMFTGPARTFQAPPDDYFVQVQPRSAGEAVVRPGEPIPADLYDDCSLQFEKQFLDRAVETGAIDIRRGGTRGGGTPAAPLPTASVTVVVPAGAQVYVRGGKDKIEHLTASGVLELPPGTYRMETHDARGVVVDRREATFEPGPRVMDLTEMSDSPLRHALLRAIPGAHGSGVVDFSESLGPTPDQGLDLWLALIGASRITGGPGDFSKLGPLPLATFDDPAIETAVYMLAGFEQPNVRLRAALSPKWGTRLQSVTPHPAFPGLFEIAAPGRQLGYQYLTVQVDDNAPVTFGVCLLHGRGTLVTLAQKLTGTLQIQQFILPLGRFLDRLPEGSGLWLDQSVDGLNDVSGPLRLVRRCVEVQRAFARAEDLKTLFTANELQFLLYFKWFEPIVAILSAYELAQRGEMQDLRTAVGNLRGYFKELPDNEALAKLAGLDPIAPAAPPLVLDGFQALNLMPERKDLPPAEALVFRGPWTMWRGLGPLPL